MTEGGNNLYIILLNEFANRSLSQISLTAYHVERSTKLDVRTKDDDLEIRQRATS